LGKRSSIDLGEAEIQKETQNNYQNQSDEEYSDEEELENYDEFIDKFNLDG